MKNPMRSLFTGIIATVPMTLYHRLTATDQEDEESSLGTSVVKGAFYGLAIWATGVVSLTPAKILQKKNVQFLPAYLLWGAALGFAENKLTAHQKRQIHALD
jgi:uncharacterized membrane protein